MKKYKWTNNGMDADVKGLWIRTSDIEPLINQEVEKRIAERITDLDIYDILRRDIELSLHDNYKGVYIDGLEKAATAVYSRLTQKTEGGGK